MAPKRRSPREPSTRRTPDTLGARQARLGAPSPALDARTRRAFALPSLLLVAATLAAYLPALAAGWIWDDDAYVTANRTLRSLAGLAEIWFSPSASPQYYPLTFTSFWLEYHLWGLTPAGYHAVNVLLHACNAVLVARIAALLGIPGGLAVAALFALHPVQVESVAWVTERKNVLSGFFYLAAAWTYLANDPSLFATATADGARRSAPVLSQVEGAHGGASRRPLLALLLFACALLSKTITCSLPAALLLIAWWKRGEVRRNDIAPLAPMFGLGTALAAMTVWMERSHVGAVGVDWQLSVVDRCLIAGRALWFYAGKLLWPTNLTFIYPRWSIDASDPWQYVYPVGALGVAAAAFALRHRIGRGPLAALLFFAGTLVPALGFFDVFPMRYTFVADHYPYLACLGLFTLAAGTANEALRRARQERAGWALGAAVSAVLAVLTWRQAYAYESAYALWNDTLAKNPGAWMAHNNLGLLRQQDGNLDAAKEHFEAAIRLKPDDDFAMINLGNALRELGHPREAMAQYLAALAANPRNALAHSNMGGMFARDGDLERARGHFAEAIRLDPGYAEAHNNLGNVLAMQGRVEDARREYETALALDPDYGDAYYNLGLLLASQGETSAAVRALERAVELTGNADHRRALDDVRSAGR